MGVTRVDGRPLQGDYQAGIIAPAGLEGPAFVVTRNFDAVYSYNAAESYGLAIALLGDRLKGLPGIQTPWPTDDPPLSRAERRELQTLLAARGYDVGEPDGRVGQKTRDAIKDVEGRIGMPPTGRPGGKVLQALREPLASSLVVLAPNLGVGTVLRGLVMRRQQPHGAGDQCHRDRHHEVRPVRMRFGEREVGGEIDDEVDEDHLDEGALQFADAPRAHPARHPGADGAVIEHEAEGDGRGEDDQHDAEEQRVDGAHHGARHSRGSAWPASSTAAPCTSFVPASPNITSAPPPLRERQRAARTAVATTRAPSGPQLPRGQALATFAGLETLDGQALATFRLPA
jgi:hypothetical protein